MKRLLMEPPARRAARCRHQHARLSLLCVCLAALGAVLGAGASPAAADEAGCPNEVLRVEQHASYLPDCRGYEMTTPAGKYGSIGLVNGGNLKVRALASGNGLFYLVPPYQAPEAVSGNSTQIFSGRSSSGWAGQDLAPVTTAWGYGLDTLSSFTPDGQVQLFAGYEKLAPGDQDEYKDLYLRDPNGTYTWVTHGTINDNAPDEMPSGFLSADGTRVFFASGYPLLPADEGRTGGLGLYEWHAGQLRVLSLQENGEQLAAGGASFGFGGSGGAVVVDQWTAHGINPISQDGRRVYMTAEEHVYLREGDRVTRLAPGDTEREFFMGATPDGAKAYIATQGQLTPDDQDTGVDLYEFDAETGALKRLSDGATHDVEGAEVDAAIGVRVSDDGSRVYFGASGTPLAPGAPAGSNLYVTDGSTTRLVAAGVSNTLARPRSETVGHPDSGWRTTPDGTHLVFITTASLSAQDQDGGALDAYEYSDETGSLELVSGGPASENSSAPVILGQPEDQTSIDITAETRVISEDGRYVFFTTTERLVPGDTNGARDVYEHDFATNTTSLLSTGTESFGATYLDSSASGSDVFFTTTEPLAPQDEDNMIDIYDARVGGGIPGSRPPASCSGDACQGALGAAPANAERPTESLHGNGNVARAHGCASLGKRARALADRARRMRRKARGEDAATAARTRERARQLARRAHRLSKQARSCHRQNGGAGR